jgi:hypothetical protein
MPLDRIDRGDEDESDVDYVILLVSRWFLSIVWLNELESKVRYRSKNVHNQSLGYFGRKTLILQILVYGYMFNDGFI